MRNNKKLFLITIIFSLFILKSLFANESKTPEFLKTYKPKPDTLIVVVFHPTMYVLESVNALKKAGFIPDNMYIVGVYNTHERTDYSKSFKFANSFTKKWIFFNACSKELSPENLFTKNGCYSTFRLIIEKADGAILFGGADIPPYLYGEKTSLLTRISTPFRHFFELSFVFNALGGFQDTSFTPLLQNKPDFTLLGICLGEQTLNTGTGGTLIQDIPSEVYNKDSIEDVVKLNRETMHRNPWAAMYPEKGFIPYSLHHIKLIKNKLLNNLTVYENQAPLVVSSHHQAVEKIGRDFEPAAYSMDGKIIEAIVHKKYSNVLGVQFHPEFKIIWTDHSAVQFRPYGQRNSVEYLLKNDNNSLDFYKNLWKWFFTSVQTNHRTSKKY
ncbi:hypothetical protein DRQ07_09945 [candidate division KSB1 bacterium]|nr:MAG: hypothetical protein DRQ07_09945 [candidate division KSB1 bacterium]